MATQLHLSSRQRLPSPPSLSHPSQIPMFAGMLPSSVVEHLDPHLLALAAGSGNANAVAPPPLDPALFAIEQVVNDVNRGRIGAGDLAMGIGLARDNSVEERHPEPEPEPVPVPVALPPPPHQHQHPVEPEQVAVHVDMPVDPDPGLEDDGIDPALREIVNSLTNAQQSHHPNLPGDAEERDRIDHEAIRTTLEDYAAQNGFGSYGAIFGGTFPQSPNNQSLMLPALGETETHSPTHSASAPVQPNISTMSTMSEPTTDEGGVPTTTKRGRGRPKGSKNKPKPRPPTPEPEPEPPRRRKGRPPKVRSAEEIAEIEQRKDDKAQGVKRKRGRPRKYPELGLVREMRLKKNRAAIQEKIRMLEERARREAEANGNAEGGHEHAHAHEQEHENANDNGRENELEREHEHALEHEQVHGRGHEHERDHDHEHQRGVEDEDDHEHEIPIEMDMGTGLRNEVALGEQVAAAVAREQGHTDHYDDWPYQDNQAYQDNQSLLDVVHGVGMGMGHDHRMDVGVGVGVGVGVLSGDGHHHVGMSQNDDMRGVFSLADVGT